MPIFDYECRGCGEQFELLVLKGTVPECPECKGQDLEQLISGFAVSSAEISQANVKAARAKLKTNKNYVDRRVAETEDVREHLGEYGVNVKPKKKEG
jgi:putative FmdB family regulatory protein